jgi:hypothetical protein
MQFWKEISYNHRNNNSDWDDVGGTATPFGAAWTGVRYPVGGAKFYLHVQSGLCSCPASCKMSAGGHFPWGQSGRDVALNTHPFLGPRLKEGLDYISNLHLGPS